MKRLRRQTSFRVLKWHDWCSPEGQKFADCKDNLFVDLYGFYFLMAYPSNVSKAQNKPEEHSFGGGW